MRLKHLGVIALIMVLIIASGVVHASANTKKIKRDFLAEKLMYQNSWDQGVVVVVYRWQDYGTGWWVWISPNREYGYLVTAAHVVQYNPSANEADITVIKGDWQGHGHVIYLDRTWDIAVIKVRNPYAAAHVFPISPYFKKGDKLIVIGYPSELLQLYSNDVYAMSRNPRAAFGDVTWIGSDHRLFEIGTYTDAGNSGGPVVNDEGAVIGIVSFALPGRTTYLYFATSSKAIINALEHAHVPYTLARSKLSFVDDIARQVAWSIAAPIIVPLALGGFLIGVITTFVILKASRRRR